MHQFLLRYFFVFILVSFLSIRSSFAQTTIKGVVIDSVSGGPLVGANVYLQGTGQGAGTDRDGAYFISGVKQGEYIMEVTYIGYLEKTLEISIQDEKEKFIHIKLRPDILEGEVITVTAQAEGQLAAINQQLSSNTITNVVSAERIQELPDANAAESVGRLPGVSIKRDGGEANKVVIRGLAPTYNTITIGGEKIPATDLDDRSVDMNMISPEILAGIEVTKALTPDKDADAFGGIVNFSLANAPDGGFSVDFRYRRSYNARRDDWSPNKASITLSNRYFTEKLGILLTGNIDRSQRGSDQFNASYSVLREKREDEFYAPISVSNVNLTYVEEIRNRIGFSILMDYRLPGGKLLFSNFMSRLDRDELIHSERWSEGSNNHEIRLRDRQRQIDVLSNSLAGEHELFSGKMDWRIARNGSLNRHPYNSRIRGRELSAIDFSKLPTQFGPDQLVAAAYNRYDEMFLYHGDFTTEKSFERDQSAQFNFKLPYTLTGNIAGYIKMGGKYIDKTKERDRSYRKRRLDFTVVGSQTNKDRFTRHHPRFGEPGFEYLFNETGWASMLNYVDPSFDPGNFLDGRYDIGAAMNRDYQSFFMENFLLDSLFRTSSLADLGDYEVDEVVTAAYIMTEINLGRVLMFLPGARYEYTRADMTGRKGTIADDEEEPELDNPWIADTSATATYARWFPMIHLRFRPVDWFDIRLAYTETLSRPRLVQMLPLKRVHSSSAVVDFGRPDLRPQIATNYDIFLSFYGNKIGLFTLGGFYKEIEDLIFQRDGHKILDWEKEGYPYELQGHTVNQPENNPFMTKVRGFEVEWQTNFRWLPSPFDGIVFYANYAHIWSKTNFPRSYVQTVAIPEFPFVRTTVIDTFRTGDMPDQSDDIANIAIGYDKGPFSARLSFLYQGETLRIVGERPELDGFTADLFRMDFLLKYGLSRHLEFFFNWNNITDEPDESYQSRTSFLTASEYYGWTMDIGIRVIF